MIIQKCYPAGKGKAFNISYDDGVLQDVRFVALLNRYGLKGTFNLNSGLMRSGFSWTHPNGMEIRRLSLEDAKNLYDGHEVASHTLTHPYMHDLNREQILEQMVTDKEYLEAIFGREVAGFAVPFSYYSDLIAQCAREAGFAYARISEEGKTFTPPQDPYWWRAGVLSWTGMLGFVNAFLDSQEELALCQIAGHSYDLDVADMWDTMDQICRSVSICGDVWPATHLEIRRYLQAMARAEISDTVIVSPSDTELWFRINGISVSVPGGSFLPLRN